MLTDRGWSILRWGSRRRWRWNPDRDSNLLIIDSCAFYFISFRGWNRHGTKRCVVGSCCGIIQGRACRSGQRHSELRLSRGIRLMGRGGGYGSVGFFNIGGSGGRGRGCGDSRTMKDTGGRGFGSTDHHSRRAASHSTVHVFVDVGMPVAYSLGSCSQNSTSNTFPLNWRAFGS